MLSILLAFSAQTAPLPAADLDAALSCAAAIRASETAPTLETAIPSMYFGMLATSLDKAEGAFAERLVQASGKILAASRTVRNAPTVIAECRKRFPRAWATAATLPQDSYERGILCTFVAGGYSGIAQETGGTSGNSSEATRASARLPFYSSLISDAEYNAHGVRTTNDIVAEFGRVMTASLTHGNLRALFNACEAAYPR
jgi:hypothetical protein